MWSGMGLDKVSTACSCICQLIFHSCLPKCLSSPRLVILCKMNNHRLKNVQGYLSWESSSDCAKWIVGILLLCFSKEIYLLLVRNGEFQPLPATGKTCCLLSEMGFYIQRSGAGGVLNKSDCIRWKRESNPSQQAKKSVAWFVWLFPVLQTREAIFGQIEHLCNGDDHQIYATCGTTELVTVGSGTVGYRCNRKLTVQGFKKKKCKKSLRGDTFLTVPWNHCQGSCIRAIYFVWV